MVQSLIHSRKMRRKGAKKRKETMRFAFALLRGFAAHLRKPGVALIIGVVSASPIAGASDIPEKFPNLIVPGHEAEMQSIRQMFWLHYQGNGPMATMWDHWLPEATLWPAVGDESQRDAMAQRWAAALSGRKIDAEGYVSTHQHDGLAHADGWPFPLWNQGRGMGWHFAGTGVHGYDATLVKPDGFVLAGATGGEITGQGWMVKLEQANATMQTPGMAVEAPMQGPFVRLNWQISEVYEGKPFLEWTTKEHPEFSEDRRMYFDVPREANVETRTMIPVYRHKEWKGVVTGLRVQFANGKPLTAVIKSIHTAYDSRHNINNSSFISGCCDYFNWTGDVEFLRKNIGRIRTAMIYAMSEFDTRKRKLVFTPWVGHDGRSGVIRSSDGKKTIVPGQGIGNNYWDIMPFGGEDCLGTIYYFEAVNKLAALERAIGSHPEWKVEADDAFRPEDLLTHAREVKNFAGQHFWNKQTGRFFGLIDVDGVGHDYGFTFVNCEAIYYGFTTNEQAESILSWLSGQRIVDGDTSTGADIYRWRFAPRATTKRNLDYYIWAWSNPESIPWGYQVQDGGAVLGFSYHDLMARLKTRGPDDAAMRLGEIATWFDEVQKAGGYREYYKDSSRGTLQGGNVPGGLGMDKEFVESILVPQVMLYGFMGFHPTAEGFSVDPKLPKDWGGLTITRVHYHDAVMSLRTGGKGVVVEVEEGKSGPVSIEFGGKVVRKELSPGVKIELN